MSRKKTQPKKNVVPDPKFNSTIIPKLINNIMYDGKRGVAAKIVYDAIEKIKTKSKDEPINIFNEAINNIMYDGKRGVAAKIVYDAIDKIKTKSKDEPINIFNEAINNIKPTVEVRSRRVGGATYQVPVEVKAKRGQALALRWLMDATRKRKNKTMAEKLYAEILDASQNKGSAIKKREDTHKMAESNKAFAHFRW